ncbi:hypothetical protein [Rothia aeria]|uniref:hypothetical protein n=1 Tax=Rothia aeria TaxID=172042 RepID=UPI0028E4CD66|nr:hypothetical protein [Rothia aeria]
MTTPSITDEQLKLWYTQRIDPPLPAHWGMPDEVSEFVGEVLWVRFSGVTVIHFPMSIF